MGKHLALTSNLAEMSHLHDKPTKPTPDNHPVETGRSLSPLWDVSARMETKQKLTKDPGGGPPGATRVAAPKTSGPSTGAGGTPSESAFLRVGSITQFI